MGQDSPYFRTPTPNARRGRSGKKIATNAPSSISMLHHDAEDMRQIELERTVQEKADTILVAGAAAVIWQETHLSFCTIQGYGHPMPTRRFGDRAANLYSQVRWTGQLAKDGTYIRVIDRTCLPPNLKRDDIRRCISLFIDASAQIARRIAAPDTAIPDELIPSFDHFEHWTKKVATTPAVLDALRARFIPGILVALSDRDKQRLVQIYQCMPSRVRERFFGANRGFENETALQFLLLGIAEDRDEG